MRVISVIIFLLVSIATAAQGSDEIVKETAKLFHQSLVKKDIKAVRLMTMDELSYGHSNGWVETKTDMLRNLETGYLEYKSFSEDSVEVKVNGNIAHLRMVTDINVNMNGKPGQYHLKVLEIWVRKESAWLLFARQAVR